MASPEGNGVHSRAMSTANATIDLRSDTVTKPTEAMRAAMATAPVGDDCYGDDPTVAALEARVAELLGKEAGLFVPGGTLGNQLAIHVQARPGQMLACVPMAHVQVHEGAAAARISGVQAMPIGERDGFRVAHLRELIAEKANGWPTLGLICVENTLGAAGGLLWPLDELQQLRAAAGTTPIHLDGARLWNAHAASGISLASLASIADTVSTCLSKGLGAPAGAVLSGPRDVIDAARACRYAFGGSMRQSGILAAAGVHALDHHLDRLGDDHRRAQRLREGLADLPGWEVRPGDTNIVLFTVDPKVGDAESLAAPLREAGILCYPNLRSELRLVTHLGTDDALVEEAIRRIRDVVIPRMGAS